MKQRPAPHKSKSDFATREMQYLKQGLTLGRILIQNTADVAGWIMKRGHYQMGWYEYIDKKERRRAYEEREWLRLLARYKFLDMKRVGEKLLLRLTAKGWQQALRDKIRCSRKLYDNGEFIAVVFDVPESEKHIRRMLRLVLAQCGFTMMQKSVWVTRKEVLTELSALLQGAKLEQWVRVLKASEVNLGVVKRLAVRTKAHIQYKK